jgi:hypothetical protein
MLAATKGKAPKSRLLTPDEKDAAEAAFRGLPFKTKWSKAARAVYDGIVAAMIRREGPPLFESDVVGVGQTHDRERR